MEVKASDVFQPLIPGDALIRRYEIVGPALKPKCTSLDGLALNVKSDFDPTGKPIFVFGIHNTGEATIQINSFEQGIALLMSQRNLLAPSDGPSVAMITQTDLAQFLGRTRETTIDGQNRFWAVRWIGRLGRANALSSRPVSP